MRENNRFIKIVGFLTLLISFSSKETLAKSAKKQSPNLNQKIEELEQKQKILERKLEVEKEQQEAKEKEASKDRANVGINTKDGFYIQSANGDYKLKIRGYIHSDGRFFLEDKGDKFANQFVLRRVRPVFEGTLSKYFDFRIMPDFGEGKVVLQDAYGNIKIDKAFQIRFGKFKEPVGLERLQSGTNLFSVERGLPTALVPNRDLGVQIHGEFWDGTLQYAAGFFNGVLDGGSTDSDNSDGKDGAARIFVHPFRKTENDALKNLGLGVAVTYGSQKGASLASPQLASYKSVGQNTFFSYRNDGTAAGTVLANGKRWRLTPQAYYYVGPFGIWGEYVRSTQEVALGAAQPDLTHSAWQLAASYVITGEENSFQGIKVKKPINPSKGQWGAVEVGGRYNELRIDKDAFPLFADPNKSASRARSWGLAANWYLSQNFKWTLSYDQTLYKGGAAAGANRANEHALFTRLQVSY